MIAVFTQSLKEIAPFLNRVHVASQEKAGGCTLVQAQIGADLFCVVETGWGKVNAGAALGVAAARFPLTQAIGLGCCGAVARGGAKRGEIAVSTQAVEYDVNFAAVGYPAPLVPGMQEGIYPADESLVRLALGAARQLRMPAYTGLFGAADRFVADEAFAEKLYARYRVEWVDTESAALAQAAQQRTLPWVWVSGISNFANVEAGDSYYKNRTAAAANACEVVYAMVKALLHPQPCADCGGGEPMSCDISLSRMKPLSTEESEEVIARARYVRLSVAENEQPYTVPMAFSWKHNEEGYVFCLYSKEEGHKMQCLAANSAVALEFDVPERDGVSSVTVQGTASILHGDFTVMCNRELSAVRVAAPAITGRRYYFCR